MDKIAIVYASRHQGNTRKLVEGLAETLDLTLIDAQECHQADLSPYDLIGFASGIDFGRFYAPVVQFLQENLPEKKKVFFLYTCAKVSDRFIRQIHEEAVKKNAVFLGAYGCRGYNTYGPWKWIGGMNKNHPDQTEIQEAVRFVASLSAEQ